MYLIPENYTFNPSLSWEEQQLHNTWPLNAPGTQFFPPELRLQPLLLELYLDPGSFGHRYLPDAVEAVQVRLREPGGQDGPFALRQIATARH